VFWLINDRSSHHSGYICEDLGVTIRKGAVTSWRIVQWREPTYRVVFPDQFCGDVERSLQKAHVFAISRLRGSSYERSWRFCTCGLGARRARKTGTSPDEQEEAGKLTFALTDNFLRKTIRVKPQQLNLLARGLGGAFRIYFGISCASPSP